MDNLRLPKLNSCIVCNGTQKRSFTYQGYDYYRCGQCGHVATLPYPSDQVIDEHYANQFKSGNYSVAHLNEVARSSPCYQYLKLLTSWFSRSHKGSLEGKEILDIGCFTGELLALLEKAGATVTGIELQREAAKIAQNRVFGTVMNESVFSADLKDKSFDVVVLSGVIEHVADPRRLVEKSVQLLKADGVLLIQTPNSGSWLARVFRQLWPPYQPVEHIHLFSHHSLKLLMNEFGCTEVHFQNHWKSLQIDYVYKMLATFGAEFHKLLRPFYKICPNFILRIFLPFYGGEMLTLFQVSKNQDCGGPALKGS
jgi:2-polyprenyl-3-methyl-5-hydroxy-6-metoxy-1,4-benzoquinol methylase